MTSEREFIKMYNTAIKKIAVGFFILDNCGDKLGYGIDTINDNKKTLCAILANGINLSITTIFYDACSVQLSRGYITQLQHSGLLEELIEAMQYELARENKIRLQNA